MRCLGPDRPHLAGSRQICHSLKPGILREVRSDSTFGQHGNDRAPIFGGTDDLRLFRERLLRTSREHGVAIHACLPMTNHVHLPATPSQRTSLPKMVQSIGRVYMRHSNFTCRGTGSVVAIVPNEARVGRSSPLTPALSPRCGEREPAWRDGTDVRRIGTSAQLRN
jgi:Transposase IS200 like